MTITFAYGLEKSVIYEKLSTEKATSSDFNSCRPFAQIQASQNSKGKFESRKILDFVKKIQKIGFFNLNFFYCFFYFIIILNFLYYFGIF
jgi:hypothetical protein